jgi:hypothetical protein
MSAILFPLKWAIRTEKINRADLTAALNEHSPNRQSGRRAWLQQAVLEREDLNDIARASIQGIKAQAQSTGRRRRSVGHGHDRNHGFGVALFRIDPAWLHRRADHQAAAGGDGMAQHLHHLCLLPALFFKLLSRTPIEQLARWDYVLTSMVVTYTVFALVFAARS